MLLLMGILLRRNPRDGGSTIECWRRLGSDSIWGGNARDDRRCAALVLERRSLCVACAAGLASHGLKARVSGAESERSSKSFSRKKRSRAEQL